MKNFQIPPLVRIAIAALIVLMLGALLGWYLYLKQAQTTLTSTDTATGLNTPAPTFGGSSGSTQVNQAIAAQPFGTTFQSGATGSATSSSQLWEVDASPVAGMGYVDTPTSEYLYYVERGNGYVFTAHPSDETSARLTNTLLPRVYQALFANDGSVIERSIDTSGNVTTFLGTISASSTATSTTSTTEQLIGSYLPAGIQQIALDPFSKAFLYLVPDANGGVDGITEQWNGTKKTQVFSSIVGSWLPYFLSDGTMAVLESPADGIAGYAYTVSASGVLAPLVRNVSGLTILPKPSSPLLIYGSSSGSSLSLFGVATSTPTLLPFATVADKCVWLPGKSEIAYCAVPNTAVPQNFLDKWYQGLVNTADDWWEIDLSTGTTQRIFSPSSVNRTLDVEDPVIDATGNYIAFINASDQSLWVLRVTQ